MLLVMHSVRKSPIHGMGLFTNEAILAGQVVWRYDPNFDVEIPLSYAEMLPEPYLTDLKTHAEYKEKEMVFILGNDGDIFMNHSETPPLIDCDKYMIAARNIDLGEELTCNYALVHVLSFPA